jgi:2-(1,2-epoxy-1,2-dihydrophenyl)acetyl-CoA isomerase
MLLTNRTPDARQALDWGLVNSVVEDADLPGAARALAARLAQGPPGAHGMVKRLLQESQSGAEAQMQHEGRAISAQAATAEGIEGIGAFLAKRPPRY